MKSNRIVTPILIHRLQKPSTFPETEDLSPQAPFVLKPWVPLKYFSKVISQKRYE
jgi:hypothetical protein